MLQGFLDVVLHLDQYLVAWSGSLGPLLYVLLFAVIFCETGLVVTPFLPGDSLLFAVGALAALPGSALNFWVVTAALIVAGILGDAVNYKVGHVLGKRAFAGEFRLIKQEHLLRTKAFYDRYGGRAIVIARFAPILRTFAPFVAGFAEMPYGRFARFNVAGGVAWVASFTTAGYLFGNIPAVKRQFHYVILGIIVVSLVPAVVEAIRARRAPPGTNAA